MWRAAIMKRAAVWVVLLLLLFPLLSPPAVAGPLKEVTLSVQGWV
jgi:hypothetical protein